MKSALLASVCVVVLVPTSAQALEISGGVSVGGILIGPDPRIAVTPHLGVQWRSEGGFALSAENLLNLLPAANSLGIGLYNQTAVGIGYAWEKINLRIGPSLSLYSIPACTIGYCGRAVGLGLGGHVQGNLYVLGPLGVSVSANLDWVAGSSFVLAGGLIGMVMIGPVLRWDTK